MALLEKAAGQGHAYAMYALGCIHAERKEHERAVEWYEKGAEAGLPNAMYNLGVALDTGEGVAAPDYPAARNGTDARRTPVPGLQRRTSATCTQPAAAGPGTQRLPHQPSHLSL